MLQNFRPCCAPSKESDDNMSKFLGLDSSTQSLTANLIDTKTGDSLYRTSINYGQELPEYKSPFGFLDNPDILVKQSDPLLWAAALDRLFRKMQDDGVRLDDIAGISGSGQQHGTVYLNRKFRTEGCIPQPGEDLATMLKSRLARPVAPIWMDSSTFDECREINKLLGGAEEVRRLTGSAATERFSGPQIRRFAKLEPDKYHDTAVIHLVSSFMCSLLLGHSAPIDYGDGSGMNLMNIQKMCWENSMLEATAPNLAVKLPSLVDSRTIAGQISEYFVREYGFRKDTMVTVWSGDNLNSLIGVGCWNPGTAVISLGTSDTYFAAMRKGALDPEGYGHVMVNPAGGYASLICFKNGSLARNKVREQYNMTWQDFDVRAFAGTPVGNHGNMMLPYYTSEITPLVLNVEKPVCEGRDIFCSFEVVIGTVRALGEAQALTLRLHSPWIGARPKTLRLTGGASRSAGICRVMSDVFGAVVERSPVCDSGALGAAMRAANSQDKISWKELTAKFVIKDDSLAVHPIKENTAIYDEMLIRYKELEQSIVG